MDPGIKTYLGKPHLGEPRLRKPHLGMPHLGEPRLGEPHLGEPRLGEPRLGKTRLGKTRLGISIFGSLRSIMVLLFVFLSAVACNDDRRDAVPNVFVDVTLNLNLPTYQPLSLVNGMIIYPQAGYRGLFIHQSAFQEFKAFDVACTQQPSDPCHTLGIDTATLLLQCPCCNSRFSADGFPARGPATFTLKSYRTFYSPSANTLRITN